jgi:AcrR family transcriptional regulator
MTGTTLARRAKTPRRASKEERRQDLIEATIDSLARRGYGETTLAEVADGAGMSRGIVNFHFESKHNLLVETLRYLSEEYRAHWRAALRAAGPGAAAQLWALVMADFDRRICNSRKLGAWCAFWGEAKSRPTYLELCGATDDEYQDMVVALCQTLAVEGQMPQRLARSLVCLLEGLWLHLMMVPKDLTRDEARASAVEFLVTAFPRHFTREGPVLHAAEGEAA